MFGLFVDSCLKTSLSSSLLAFAALLQSSAELGSLNPKLRNAKVIPLLPPRPGNARNTEGSFVQLRDGRILFAFSKFEGKGEDNDSARIVGRLSGDGGMTWSTEDIPLVNREGQLNVMSVSFLRLQDGRIAMFYLRKNSESDCHPYLRYSSDEARTWSEPILCIREDGYYVLNNDRAVQLRSGRLVLPVALHASINGQFEEKGVVMSYFSDDAGKTWRRSTTTLKCPSSSKAGFQEPGVVELKDGRVMMFIRTMMGSQYLSYSHDAGDTWSPAERSFIFSPLSSASIKRIPKTGDLLLIWNDHSSVNSAFRASEQSGGKRTPLTVAISKDEGRSWIHAQNLMDDPDGWYCYPALFFAGDNVLLAFASGGRGLPRLSKTDIASFPVNELYGRSNP